MRTGSIAPMLSSVREDLSNEKHGRKRKQRQWKKIRDRDGTSLLDTTCRASAENPLTFPHTGLVPVLADTDTDTDTDNFFD
jgi:hypothetical protein